MFVKLCGLSTLADVEAAADAGADAVGFVFAESVRQVTPQAARRLVTAVPPEILTVGVFRGFPVARVVQIAAEAGLGAIQLHGRYPREDFAALAGLPFRLIRAISVESDLDEGQTPRVGAFGEDLLLLDAPVAGAGKRWDTSELAGLDLGGPWLLAGGLTPANVGETVADVRPWGVDVSSGIESAPGVQDGGLIREFVAAARTAGTPAPKADERH